jgi:serine protease
VQRKPHVYVVFWGPAWTSNAVAAGAARYLTSLYRGLGQGLDTWSLTATQYGGKNGRPAFGASVLKGTYVIKSTPPKPLTLAKLAGEAVAAAKHFKITDTLDAQVIIAAQPGTCFAAVSGLQFTGNCGKRPASPPTNGYCGWHSAISVGKSYLTFTNLPFQLDAGSYCGENLINSSAVGRYDGFSLVGGHEYAESVTDPVGDTGWIDLADNLSGGEVADKCAWGGVPFGLTDPQGNITLSTGKFAMQSLWNNATRSCRMSGKLALRVTSLGNQAATIGKAVSLRVSAATTPAAPLTYKAAGLPGGLSISRAGTIGGTPNVTAGIFTAKVTVAYYAGSFGFSFKWYVSSLPGAVRGQGKCANDAGGLTRNGNPIVLWTCNGKAAQRITFAANRELRVAGKCITGGRTAFLEPCKAAASQSWTRRANGEYVLAVNGKCLTAPAKGNGTRLALAACKNTANQHWSLP